MGIAMVVGLFAMFGYAGLQHAQQARDRYGEAARRGPHGRGPGPGDDQPLRGPGARPAHRRAAPVRLLRQLEPAHDAGHRRACSSTSPARPVRDCASSTVASNGKSKSRHSGGRKPPGTSCPRWRSPTRCGLAAPRSRSSAPRDRAEAKLVPAAGYEIDFLECAAWTGATRCGPPARWPSPARAVPASRGAAARAPTRSWAAAGTSRRPPASPRSDAPAAGADRGGRRLGLANRLLARRARRVCLAFPIAGRRASATSSPGGRSRPPSPRRTAAPRGALRPERTASGASWSSAAARGRARSTRAALDGLLRPGAPIPRAPHLRARATTTARRRLAGRTRRRVLHAARVRAQPRRCARRLRPRPRPRGRLRVRARRGGTPGDPRPVSLRHRPPPARERRMDGDTGRPR